MEAIALGKVCAACGTSRKTKQLMVDVDTFLPYCSNPYICDRHPNSPANLLERGYEMKLVPFEEAEQFFRTKMLEKYDSPEFVNKIKRLIEKPSVVRISNPDQAQFLVELEDELALGNMSETIRYCIQFTKERFKSQNKAYYEVKQELKSQKDVKDVEQEIARPKPKPEPVTQTQDEEEFLI